MWISSEELMDKIIKKSKDNSGGLQNENWNEMESEYVEIGIRNWIKHKLFHWAVEIWFPLLCLLYLRVKIYYYKLLKCYFLIVVSSITCICYNNNNNKNKNNNKTKNKNNDDNNINYDDEINEF